MNFIMFHQQLIAIEIILDEGGVKSIFVCKLPSGITVDNYAVRTPFQLPVQPLGVV